MGSLRTLFAISVVFAHTFGFVFVGGRNAVQLFYMISGFLISYVLVEKKLYASSLNFYINRYLRLFPIYISIVLLTLLFYAYNVVFLGNVEFFTNFQKYPDQGKILLALSNSTLFLLDWMMFLAVDDNKIVFTPNFSKSELPLYAGLVIPQAWTLGVELSFYLIAPFVLHRKKYLFFILILSFLIRIILFQIDLGRVDPWAYRFFPAELSFFILGALSHQFLLPTYQKVIPNKLLGNTANIATYVLIAFTIIYWLIPFSNIAKSILLFIVFFVFMPFTFIFEKSHPWDRWIGELSYPIYISHMLIILIANSLYERLFTKNSVLLAAVVILFSVLFSILLNAYISKPVEKWRDKIRSSKKFIV